MSRPLPLTLVQAEPQPLHSPFSDFADHAHSTMADYPQTRLLVYPELHLYGIPDGTNAERTVELEASAQPLDGELATSLAALAAELGIWLLPGTLVERGSDQQMYNTAAVFSPVGELAASYRKIFPWRPYEPYRPGSKFVVFDMEDVGRIGLSICYDAWFPEVSRHLAWMGAELIINPTQTTTSDRQQELILSRANAIANQVFVVSLNVAAPFGRGRSVISDPEGRVRLEAGTAPEVLTDVIDLDAVSHLHTYGTAGVNRMWSQFLDGDQPLELPLYNGRIDPERWRTAP